MTSAPASAPDAFHSPKLAGFLLERLRSERMHVNAITNAAVILTLRETLMKSVGSGSLLGIGPASEGRWSRQPVDRTQVSRSALA